MNTKMTCIVAFHQGLAAIEETSRDGSLAYISEEDPRAIQGDPINRQPYKTAGSMQLCTEINGPIMKHRSKYRMKYVFSNAQRC